MLLFGLFALTTAGFASFYLYRKLFCHRYFKKLGIPGPEPHWLWGNLHQLLRPDRQNVMHEWSLKYGEFYGYFEGPTPILVVSNLEAVEQICVKQFPAFQGHRVVPIQPDAEKEPDSPMNHLLFAQGDRWKRLRTTVNPAFSSGKLKSYSSQMAHCQNDLMELFQQEAVSGKAFDIRRVFQFLTLDVIAMVGFNIEFNAVRNRGEGNPVMKNLQEFLDVSANPAPPLDFARVFPAVIPAMKVMITWQLKKMTGLFRSIGVLLDLIGQIMTARRKDESNRRNDLLQLMMDVSESSKNDGKQTINEEEIKAMSFIFFVAGYDTTASTLGCIAYCLATNPDVQEKLRAEIYSKYPKDMRNIHPDYDTVMNMTYLDWCCRETMRLFPLAFTIINRFVVSDTELCGVPVSTDIGGVLVDMYSIHFNKDLWGPVDPKKYYPERFSPENSENRPDVAFMAFGFGPRQCVGMRLALFEMKTTLTMMLHRFRIEPPDGGYPPEGLRLNCREGFVIPENGVPVKMAAFY